LLRQFGSPEEIFRAPLRQLEACELPSATAQAVFKKDAWLRRLIWRRKGSCGNCLENNSAEYCCRSLATPANAGAAQRNQQKSARPKLLNPMRLRELRNAA
jgi:hypothetical protein